MAFRVRPVTFDIVTNVPEVIKKITRGFARSPELLDSVGKYTVQRARLYASPFKASGQLLGGIKYRVSKDRALVSSEAPVSPFIHEGVVPHWIHRDMISVEGYSVGDWMDSRGMQKRNYLFVGGSRSRIAKPGSKFMERAYRDGTVYARGAIERWIKLMR